MENNEVMETMNEVIEATDVNCTGANWFTGAIGFGLGVVATILAEKVVVPVAKAIRANRKAKKEQKVIVVNADEDRAVIGKQFLQQSQSRVHHAEPLVVAREIFTLLADDLAEPFLDLWVVHVVVVHPTFIARVVWRINVDALDFSLVLRQKRL